MSHSKDVKPLFKSSVVQSSDFSSNAKSYDEMGKRYDEKLFTGLYVGSGAALLFILSTIRSDKVELVSQVHLICSAWFFVASILTSFIAGWFFVEHCERKSSEYIQRGNLQDSQHAKMKLEKQDKLLEVCSSLASTLVLEQFDSQQFVRLLSVDTSESFEKYNNDIQEIEGIIKKLHSEARCLGNAKNGFLLLSVFSFLIGLFVPFLSLSGLL